MHPGQTAAQSGAQAGGGWLFRQRSWLPVPIALVLLLVRWGMTRHPALPIVGPLLVAAGEGLRWWAVGQIGVISRTRTTRLGPLITSGPFALCRNPLYVANLLQWAGFTVWSGLLWMLPITLGLFILYYRSIIDWEEALLTERFGEAYARYVADTPRWRPRLDRLSAAFAASAMHPWREVAFSERGTLAAIGVGAILLVIRQLVG
jgi:protein-S-isoprenylcysteine O-methyltransferase Ste14